MSIDPVAMMPTWCLWQTTHCPDGDTVRGQAVLGLGVELRSEVVRLLGIETWEMRSSEAMQAREARRYLSRLVQGRVAYLHTPRDSQDRYGRWLGWLWLRDGDSLVSVNHQMIEAGMAWEWWPTTHRGPRQLPPLVVPVPDLSRLASRE